MTEKRYAHLAPNYVADTIRAKFPNLGISERGGSVKIQPRSLIVVVSRRYNSTKSSKPRRQELLRFGASSTRPPRCANWPRFGLMRHHARRRSFRNEYLDALAPALLGYLGRFLRPANGLWRQRGHDPANWFSDQGCAPIQLIIGYKYAVWSRHRKVCG